MAEDKPGLLRGMVMGIVMTLLLIVVVPLICNHFILKFVTEIFGDMNLLGYSSVAIVNFVMWIIIIGFMLLLGGGSILKKYGVIGVVGLVVAYWIMGNIYDAIIPVVILTIVAGIMYLVKGRKSKKK